MSPLRDSPRIELRLEQTLAQWRQWRCDPPLPGAPHVIGPLDGGLSNHNFLVRATTNVFVVRIDGINPANHGLNRQVEWMAMQDAAEAGLAPTPRYFNPELGALVVDFHEAEPNREIAVDSLARLLRSIHQLPHKHHRVNLPERVRRYQHWLQRSEKPLPPAYATRRMDDILGTLKDGSTVLTHNDLMPANLLHSGDTLLALDWEYCGMGSPWFDLATASLGQALDTEQEQALLHLYLGDAPSGAEIGLLRHYRAIGRYLELLWHLAESPAQEAPALLEKGLPLLERELP